MTVALAAPVEHRHAFRAMGTDVLVIVAAGRAAAGSATESLFRAHEDALSRFRPESELSALNAVAGRPFRASPLLRDAIRAGLAAADETGGLVDPTVLAAVVAAGYDRSFERIDREAPVVRRPPAFTGAWRAIVVDDRTGTVTLPPGVGLDLGGVAKGWTVDRSVARLGRGSHFAIDAGGDLYASGSRPDGGPWTVGVADPRAAAGELVTITVRDEAVATSTTLRRSWRGGHHLIDPRDGRPSRSDVVQATVVASSVLRAETLAKAALILGRHAGLALLDERGVDGILVTRDARTVATSGFARRRAA